MSKQYFWSLVLTSESASAALWTRTDEETTIVSQSQEYSVASGGDFVTCVDSSLSEIASDIPEEAGEPSKVIFGVFGGWVKEGKIDKKHLVTIREICGKLSLSPIGFVVLPESLAHDAKEREGAPLTAILIGVSMGLLEVSLFKLGNFIGTVEVGRSVSIEEDVAEALIRFEWKEPLPSRMLIYGSADNDLQGLESSMNSYDWEGIKEENITFLHPPKVELVDHKKALVAVSIAGSSEMGPIKHLVLPEEKHDEAQRGAEGEVENVSPSSWEEIGFVKNQDIAKINPTVFRQEEEEEGIYEEVPEFQETHSTADFAHTTKARKRYSILNFFKTMPKSFIPQKKLERHEEIAQKPHIIKPKRGGRKKLYLMGTLLLFALIGVFAAWYFTPKATVALVVAPRSITQREQFTVDLSATSINMESKVIPGVLVNKEVGSTETSQATGKKVVGERAKGKVTVRNGTSSGIKLPIGALLTGPNDLKFGLEEGASVSAALSPTTPGTVTLSAIAGAIGAEYNIAQNESLKVGNFSKSEIDAVVAESFAGGSSRQITAISRSDLDSLEKSLLSTLTGKAKEDLGLEVGADKLFVSDSTEVKVKNKVFSRKVGDEAESVSLDMTVEATGVVIPKSVISEISDNLLKSQVPQGFVFRPEETQSSFEVQKSGSQIVLTLTLTANLLPDIDPLMVANKIKGKKSDDTLEYLSTIPGFVRARISFETIFPQSLRVIPFIAKNTTVSVEADR